MVMHQCIPIVMQSHLLLFFPFHLNLNDLNIRKLLFSYYIQQHLDFFLVHKVPPLKSLIFPVCWTVELVPHHLHHQVLLKNRLEVIQDLHHYLPVVKTL